MDLSTVEKNLKENAYTITEEFVNDILLIWENCILYNSESSRISYNAIALKKISKKLFDKYEISYDESRFIEKENTNEILDLDCIRKKKIKKTDCNNILSNSVQNLKNKNTLNESKISKDTKKKSSDKVPKGQANIAAYFLKPETKSEKINSSLNNSFISEKSNTRKNNFKEQVNETEKENKKCGTQLRKRNSKK